MARRARSWLRRRRADSPDAELAPPTMREVPRRGAGSANGELAPPTRSQLARRGAMSAVAELAPPTQSWLFRGGAMSAMAEPGRPWRSQVGRSGARSAMRSDVDRGVARSAAAVALPRRAGCFWRGFPWSPGVEPFPPQGCRVARARHPGPGGALVHCRRWRHGFLRRCGEEDHPILGARTQPGRGRTSPPSGAPGRIRRRRHPIPRTRSPSPAMSRRGAIAPNVSRARSRGSRPGAGC
jgi:hypothetical protein